MATEEDLREEFEFFNIDIDNSDICDKCKNDLCVNRLIYKNVIYVMISTHSQAQNLVLSIG